MKKKLHKVLGILFLLATLAGGLIPANTAAAASEYERASELLETNLEKTGMHLNGE